MYLIRTRVLLTVVRSCCERTIPPPRGREGEGAVPRNYAATWRILDAGSDQPHQKADQRKSAEQHGPIPHVELKKTTVCRNLHIREHDQL